MGKIITYSILVIVFWLTVISIGCAHYSEGPWSGKVIDAETKQPIEGADVVAVWNEAYPSIPEMTSRTKAVKEVLTDSNGVFYIDKKSYYTSIPGSLILGPLITIYKPGYGYFPAQHKYPKLWDKDYFLNSNAVVELPQWKTIKERREKLPSDDEPGVKHLKIYMKLLNQEKIDIGYPIR